MTGNYGFIKNISDLDRAFDKLAEDDSLIGFDVETGYDGPDRVKGALAIHWPRQFVAGFSFTNSSKWSRYVPLRHDMGPNLDEDRVWEIVRPVLEQKRILAHHLKFEQRNVRKMADFDIGLKHDSLLESYCAALTSQHGLKFLVEHHLGHHMADIKDLFPGWTAKQISCLRFNVLELTPEVTSYACEDTAWMMKLHEFLEARLEGTPQKFVYDLEMRISDILADMEDWGVEIDWAAMTRSRAEAESFAPLFEQEVLAEFGALAGRDLTVGFSLNSTAQLRELLFDQIGMVSSRETKGGGKQSTDKVAMAGLAKQYPVVQKLLDYRSMKKLASKMDTWMDVDPKKFPMKGGDGRVHPNMKQTTVETGRFAADNPTIQQCEKHFEWTLNDETRWEGSFRDYIVAREGWYLIGFDYSQIELRVVAGLAGEQSLLDMFDRGIDAHVASAALMLGKRVEDVTKDDRAIGKTMNFALLYGAGAKRVADTLVVSRERANELVAAYHSGLPAIAAWSERQTQIGMTKKFTTSWIGRRCYIYELDSVLPGVISKGERKIVNVQVQGGAADYVKIAMVKAAQQLRKKGWWGESARMVMNQHDALYFEVRQEISPAEFIEVVGAVVEFDPSAMSGIAFPKIVAEWEWGQSWGSMGTGTSEPSDLTYTHAADDVAVGLPPDVDPEDEPPASSNGASGVGAQVPRDASKTVGEAAASSAPDPNDADSSGSTPMLDMSPRPTPTNGRVDAFLDELKAQRVVVTISKMPTKEEFDRLLDLLAENQGPNLVTLRTPDGDLDLTGSYTDLGIADRGKFAMAMASVTGVTLSPESVDLDEVGVEL